MRISINHIIQSLSDLTMKLGFQITLPPLLPISMTPPTLFFIAAATPTITSSSSDRTRPDAVPSALTSILTPVVGSGKTTAATGTYTSTLPPNLEQHFSSVESKSTANRLDEALHLVVGEFKKVYTGVIDGGSMKVAIKRGSSMSDQICPDVYSFGIAPFEVLCVRQALDPKLPKKQKWTGVLTEHKLFGLMLERNGKKNFEKVVFIFDPGGVLRMSKLVLAKEYSCFSHRVQFDMQGSFYIIFFPRKNEIWTVDLDLMLQRRNMSKFAEVVPNYSEDDEVFVFSLARAESRTKSYKRAVLNGFELCCRFSRSFISMLSHKVLMTRVEENGLLLGH